LASVVFELIKLFFHNNRHRQSGPIKNQKPTTNLAVGFCRNLFESVTTNTNGRPYYQDAYYRQICRNQIHNRNL
jgi:hypothetical protein